MDFLNKVSQKVSDSIKGIQKKTNVTVLEHKLYTQIKQNEEKISALFNAIGEVYYNSPNDVDRLSEMCAQIDALKGSIREINNSLDELNNMRRCPTCNTQVSDDVNFCPVCGTKISNEIVVEIKTEAKQEELCPECQAVRMAGALFCDKCGYRFPVKTNENEEPENNEE